MKFIIEVSPREPRASICGLNGESVANDPDVIDCCAPGDAEPACRYLLGLGIEFRIVARNALGEYENRLASDCEIAETARAIYFDSESDFSDVETAKSYLVWAAAADCENESEN